MKTNMKRMLQMVLLLTMVATLLIGCTGETAISQDASQTQKSTLREYTWKVGDPSPIASPNQGILTAVDDNSIEITKMTPTDESMKKAYTVGQGLVMKINTSIFMIKEINSLENYIVIATGTK